MKILIIDDEQGVLKMYETGLKMAGFEVMLAPDGASGLKLAQEQKPNVILLDIIMPRYNGLDILKDLKADERTKNIPVWLLTNLPRESSGQKAQELGAANYLVKAECEPNMLVEKLKQEIK